MEQYGREVLEKLIQSGFQAFFVGGYVRDKLLGRPVHDIDIATDALPDQVIKIFSRTVETGIRHGTVTVIHKGYSFEVTTFRREGEYLDRRRPQYVEFVGELREDLARRDFTINAMAMDVEGEIIDPFHGQEDLRRKIIRTVGRADQRFAEDALRMLRAVRFASQLDFEIEPDTWHSLKQMAFFLKDIARERIADELNKWIQSSHPEKGYRLLAESGLLQFFEWHDRLFKTTLDCGSLSPVTKLNDLTSRWCVLFIVTAVDETSAHEIMAQLGFPKIMQKRISLMLNLYHSFSDDNQLSHEKVWKRLLVRHGWDDVNLFYLLITALNQSPFHEGKLQQLFQQLPVKDISELAVSGKELMDELHQSPGPWIGSLLEQLVDLVNIEGIPNMKSVLLEQARKEWNRL